jgi:hypothetical protein
MLTAEPPVHELPEQASPVVHTFPSSQATAVRHCQTPPVFVQRYAVPPQEIAWHRVWVDALHVYVEPPPHVPLARFAPHPEQLRDTTRLLVEQLSAHEPAVVPQPEPALQDTVQHWLLPPTAHVVDVALHEHVPQPPPPVQYRVHVAG